MSRIKEPENQLHAAMCFVEMSRSKEQCPRERRHSYLLFAAMHACQASTYEYNNPQWGFSIHDFKHRLIDAAEAVMNGKPIEEVMENFENYQPKEPLILMED